MKTGALLRFGCLAGAILGKADAKPASALERYGLRSAKRSRSPTISSTWKAIRRRWARHGKDRRRPQGHLVGVLGPRRRGAGSRAW
jgi:hypothetical protein